MQENYMVCNCKQVSYNDIIDVLHNKQELNDVLSAFHEVQKITQCSTGCGGCYAKIINVISDAMYGYETKPQNDSCKR